MLGWWRGLLSLIGSGRVLALRNGLFNPILESVSKAASAVSGPKQDVRKISAIPIVALTRNLTIGFLPSG
jgi:hypothetical protein